MQAMGVGGGGWQSGEFSECLVQQTSIVIMTLGLVQGHHRQINNTCRASAPSDESSSASLIPREHTGADMPRSHEKRQCK